MPRLPIELARGLLGNMDVMSRKALPACATLTLVGLLAFAEIAHAEDLVEAARVEAHAGRYDEAIARYRAILQKDPRNADARAGLVDVLIWTGQLDLADRELDIGLAYDRSVPALMARRARVLKLRGDIALGRTWLDRAEHALPNDTDLRDLGDRMWRGEGRFRMRNDFFPPGWDDLPTAELSLQQHVGRALLGVRTEQSRRFGSAYGLRSYNAFYAASLGYTVAPGWVPGVEGGFGAPARAIPDWLGRVFLYFPIVGPLDGYAAASWSHYPNGTHVQTLNPVLILSLGERTRLEGRYWLARATAEGADPVLKHSFGARVVYHAARALDLEGHWVWGTQVDRLPNTDQLASIRSSFFGLAFDIHVLRELGVRPMYELEIRKNPRGDVIQIHGAELAVYARW